MRSADDAFAVPLVGRALDEGLGLVSGTETEWVP